MTTKATRDVIDLSTRPVQSVDIDGGSIDNTVIGASVPNAGFFTNLQAANLTVTSSATFDGATLSGVSAFYADLAEYYEADAEYAPGTVVKLGGSKEITQVTEYGDNDVFGVISDNPAITMNAPEDGKSGIHLPVAVVGRTPCMVEGPVRKGQRLTPGGKGYGTPSVGVTPGLTFARSLVDDDSEGLRLVEVTVVAVI